MDEIGFIWKVARHNLRDKVRSSIILRKLWVELFFHTERSWLWWYRHLIKMSPGCLSLEIFQAHPTRRRPSGRPKALWRNMCPLLPKNTLESLRRKWSVANGRVVWVSFLNLLLPWHIDILKYYRRSIWTLVFKYKCIYKSTTDLSLRISFIFPFTSVSPWTNCLQSIQSFWIHLWPKNTFHTATDWQNCHIEC